MADAEGRDVSGVFPGVTVKFVEEIAREAGSMVRKHFFDREKVVTTKDNPADLVTEIDKAVENTLKERIRTAFPQHRFLCEGKGISSKKRCIIPFVQLSFRCPACRPDMRRYCST